MHSAVVGGALLLFEVRNAPPKQDTLTLMYIGAYKAVMSASLLLIICKYVYVHTNVHKHIHMYVLGTYGSPDIAIATYTCTFIHTQLNASNTHTHLHMLGWARQTTFEQNSQLFTTRGSQKLFAIAEAAAAVTHHKYTYTRTHTHSRYTRMQDSSGSKSKFIIPQSARAALKFMRRCKIQNEKKSCSFNSFLAKQRAKKTRAKESERQTDTETERTRVTVLPEF